jgi:hypothetical protein
MDPLTSSQIPQKPSGIMICGWSVNIYRNLWICSAPPSCQLQYNFQLSHLPKTPWTLFPVIQPAVGIPLKMTFLSPPLPPGSILPFSCY